MRERRERRRRRRRKKWKWKEKRKERGRKREKEAPVNSIIAYTSINYTSCAIIAIIRMNMNTIYIRETRVPAWLRDRGTICFRAANLRNNADVVSTNNNLE